MGFSEKQVSALQRKLDDMYVRSREFQGRILSYIEGWHAIAEANRIFGFDGWDRETVESRCVSERDNDGGFHAVYVAKVRITVRAQDQTVVREGYGTGEALGSTLGTTHEKALKTAETDATKRALATFGKPFGLSLYVTPRKAKPVGNGIFNPLPGVPPIPETSRRRTRQEMGASGRYFVPARTRVALDPGLRGPLLPDLAPDQLGEPRSATVSTLPLGLFDGGAVSSPIAPSADPATSEPREEASSPPIQPAAEGKSPLDARVATTTAGRTVEQAAERLMIDWPKRHREPEHLKFVRTQPCLMCGRTPSDAHHLRFAQSRGVGLKVSDEFTVPLCRVHHDQLHQSGKEIDWWRAMDRDVDPLQVAQGLWEESRGNRPAADTSGAGSGSLAHDKTSTN